MGSIHWGNKIVQGLMREHDRVTQSVDKKDILKFGRENLTPQEIRHRWPDWTPEQRAGVAKGTDATKLEEILRPLGEV